MVSSLSRRNNNNNNNTPPGAGHRVVVEGLSTRQDSHLTGKPGAGEGSLFAGGQQLRPSRARVLHHDGRVKESAFSLGQWARRW